MAVGPISGYAEYEGRADGIGECSIREEKHDCKGEIARLWLTSVNQTRKMCAFSKKVAKTFCQFTEKQYLCTRFRKNNSISGGAEERVL